MKKIITYILCTILTLYLAKETLPNPEITLGKAIAIVIIMPVSTLIFGGVYFVEHAPSVLNKCIINCNNKGE